jgi:hypothetical protein
MSVRVNRALHILRDEGLLDFTRGRAWSDKAYEHSSKRRFGLLAPNSGAASELTNETGAIADKPDIPYYYVH